MNTKLLATLAALAISAPLMGCAGETDAPDQQEGVKQDAVQGDSTNDDQKTADQQRVEDEKLRQAEPNSCEPNAAGVNENPCCGGYCWY